MADINLWALGGIGLVAGLLGSTLGVGGGILIVPMLTLALHLPIHIAIGSSLVAIVATSCTAASIYTKNRLTNVKLGLLLETATAPGAIVGGLVVALLASSLLSALFGVILIYVAYTMLVRQSPIAEGNTVEGNSAKSNDAPANSSQWLSNSYYDRSLSKLVTYKVSHIPQGLGAGFFSGALSSLLGIGGGVVQVPILNMVMGLPMKPTIATSTFMIAITATVGALIHYYHGHVYPIIVAPLIVGVFLGARLGAELAQRVRGTLLRRIFGVFLFVTALLMFLRAANIV
ncbi:MAG: sulfite exporter TauE/SafE family protein [Dehalococcoidia bacterium]|nr:sulfite exporter TauE/SafE family protein [Dehalococcoidia bacterium]